MKVYLAGPEVFHPDAAIIGARKKDICKRYGLTGPFPLDNALEDSDACSIFRANCALMDTADLIIANMTPFRSISMDPGTAFEMGYMLAQGKPILAYTNAGGDLVERAREAGMLGSSGTMGHDGLAVEDFGRPDNLMMVCAVEAAGFRVFAREEDPLPPESLYTDLSLFERCVGVAAQLIPSPRN